MKFFIFFLACCPLVAQTDLRLPWVVDNQTFKTLIVVNNYGDQLVDVTLFAIRPDGRGDRKSIRLQPFRSFSQSAATFFPRLSRGLGYTVQIISEFDDLAATATIWSTTTDSGFSPSQIHAVPASEAAPNLVYNFVPTNTGIIAAPVALNLGSEAATVTFKAILDGLEMGQFQVNIEPGHVFAESSAAMFPDIQGNLYVIAQSDQPLLGTSFLFNELLEPSMAAAQPLPF